MTRMVRDNPHSEGIGTREGILFTDVRLHVGLATRQQNAVQFRPDVLLDSLEVGPEILGALGKAQAFARIRYTSPTLLPDRRHLRFIPHMASAISHLGSGLVVLDLVKEAVWTSAGFDEWLHDNGDQEAFEHNVRIVDKPEQSGLVSLRSKGLVKIGLPEIEMAPAQWDLRTLLQEVTVEATKIVWQAGNIPAQIRVEVFGDQFDIIFAPPRKGAVEFRVRRAN